MQSPNDGSWIKAESLMVAIVMEQLLQTDNLTICDVFNIYNFITQKISLQMPRPWEYPQILIQSVCNHVIV